MAQIASAPLSIVAAAAALNICGNDTAIAEPVPGDFVRNGPVGAVYDVRDSGAVGDGKAIDTSAVQAAIDTCASKGGGTVVVPSGTYLVGSLELKSNVTLHIAAGGTLLGTTDGSQYHPVDAIPLSGDTTLKDGNWALLYAVGAKNITIEGSGTIDGQGVQFQPNVSGALSGTKRPYHILAYQAKNLLFAISICSIVRITAFASYDATECISTVSTFIVASM
jgi:hypothetical protein